MKLTQKDIQYVMNEANNIIAEQREQGTADINEGKFSEMNEAKLTANYIAETVKHLKTLYGYIKNRESMKCLPSQWVEVASGELSAANKLLGAANNQYKALAKKMAAQNGIRTPRQMDENIVDTAKEWGNKIYNKAQQAGKAVAAAHDPKKRNAGTKMMASKAGQFAKKGAEAIKKAGIGQSAKQLSQQQQQQQQGQK